MSNELDPKEIARIRKLARARRIRLIRGRAALGAATLAALFSATILARTQLDPSTPADLLQTSSVSRSSPQSSAETRSDSGESRESDGGSVLDEIVGAVSGVLSEAGSLTSGQDQTSAAAPAQAPLTTSQS